MVKVHVESVGSGGLTLPEPKVVPTVAESRLLRLPIGGLQPAQLGSFRFRNGRYTIPKAASAALIYGVDVQDWLEDAGTTLAKVETESVRGVSAPGAPFIRGTVIGVLLEGLNLMEGAINTYTFRFTCRDGQSSTVTIGFEKG